MIPALMVGLVGVQLACLVTGVIEAWRYRHSTECFERAFIPWLAIAMAGGPVLALIRAVAS